MMGRPHASSPQRHPENHHVQMAKSPVRSPAAHRHAHDYGFASKPPLAPSPQRPAPSFEEWKTMKAAGGGGTPGRGSREIKNSAKHV